MIVKNEEEMLPDCLESVEGIVDEIIVVDTGSTDKTVEIAQQFGAILNQLAVGSRLTVGNKIRSARISFVVPSGIRCGLKRCFGPGRRR